jgi:thioredoxin reductase
MSKTILPVAIIGAGPYGLSVAAHLRGRGIAFRIFGRPMDSWRAHMPKGMMLKSDGFASDIYDPASEFTLKQFCSESEVQYRDTGLPVRAETFTSYGLAFQERMVPKLEDKLVSSVEQLPDGFSLRLDDGEVLKVRRVVLAVGITHFQHIPTELTNLPPTVLSHSGRYHDVNRFEGQRVVVIGGGSSALDWAGLLHQAGIDVQLVSRRKELKFHTKPNGKARSWWQQIRHPQSGLGPGLRSRFFANAPQAFYFLPERSRVQLVRKALGPSGGWFSKDMVVGKVPTLLSHTVERAEVQKGSVHLHLRAADGATRDIETDHVIAATGYKVQMDRLTFLSQGIRSSIKAIEGAPILSSRFESSVPGLYFVGVAAANSFGPVMRFAFGARFAAERVTDVLARSSSKAQTGLSTSSVVTEHDVTSVR